MTQTKDLMQLMMEYMSIRSSAKDFMTRMILMTRTMRMTRIMRSKPNWTHTSRKRLNKSKATTNESNTFHRISLLRQLRKYILSAHIRTPKSIAKTMAKTPWMTLNKTGSFILNSMEFSTFDSSSKALLCVCHATKPQFNKIRPPLKLSYHPEEMIFCGKVWFSATRFRLSSAKSCDFRMRFLEPKSSACAMRLGGKQPSCFFTSPRRF
mmetsp:Transcript_17751/g.39136  ORF Transcript_17751/g.39136 Transcript_17751/m.39136 type:complete len:209 (+) Transcript_17751:967-1593(+)